MQNKLTGDDVLKSLAFMCVYNAHMPNIFNNLAVAPIYLL